MIFTTPDSSLPSPSTGCRRGGCFRLLCLPPTLIPVLLFTFFSTSAHAYLDPGSVSLVLQSVVAAIAGAVLFWKHWYYRLLGIFGIRKKDISEKNADWKDDQIKAEDE